jgi:hypothetical protein
VQTSISLVSTKNKRGHHKVVPLLFLMKLRIDQLTLNECESGSHSTTEDLKARFQGELKEYCRNGKIQLFKDKNLF